MQETVKGFDRTALLKREIFKFLKTLESFCEERNIPKNFVEFLKYKTKENQYLPDCYKFVYHCPVILLSASKTYKQFYFELDPDFKEDLPRPNVKALFIPANNEIIKFIQKFLGKDFILSK